MNTIRAYFSGWYWRNGFSLLRAAAGLLSAFGALWLIVEIVAFFSESAANWLKSVWWLFLLVGLTSAIWLNRPRHRVYCKLSGRDVLIEVCVGDVFDREGSLIVGSNTTFDTHDEIIDARSIQGQFTSKSYTSVSHLDTDIDAALRGITFESCPHPKPGKQNLYPIGTVAKVQAAGRSAYLLAIASINQSSVADATFDDLKLALPALWDHISSRGGLEAIVIPVLGTGFSRLPQSREEIVREIISSFVAACSMRRFTPSLTVVVHGPDFYKNEVDLEELGRYLRHVCRYTQFGGGAGRGTAL